MTGVDEAAERSESIGEHLRFRRQPALRPVGDRDIVERAHRFDHCKARILKLGVPKFRS